jgi:hypothetical protein
MTTYLSECDRVQHYPEHRDHPGSLAQSLQVPGTDLDLMRALPLETMVSTCWYLGAAVLLANLDYRCTCLCGEIN